MTDTIFAHSSGSVPAALAIIRISGPAAGRALAALAGKLPPPRRVSLRSIVHPDSAELLDRALIVWLPGPATATGEDMAEIHAHGSRAVVRAIEDALSTIPSLRRAEPGEFTRRALGNDIMDLTEVEGLSDLLAAETAGQRRQALHMAGGALSRQIAQWQDRVLTLSAQTEALLDFADEDDVADDHAAVAAIVEGTLAIAAEWGSMLDRPPAERLRDGVRVVIAGPPNSGKSTLINSLANEDVAIVSPQAGTTRDVIETALQLAGRPFRVSDTAGLRPDPGDVIERAGIVRALARIDQADIIIWLGEPEHAPKHPAVIRVAAQADRFSIDDTAWLERCASTDVQVSAVTGQGMGALVNALLHMADGLLPRDDDLALNARQRSVLTDCLTAIAETESQRDLLIIADSLRVARVTLDRLTGRAGTEAMLDALFGRFCIGK